jgi:hypothetical protein
MNRRLWRNIRSSSHGSVGAGSLLRRRHRLLRVHISSGGPTGLAGRQRATFPRNDDGSSSSSSNGGRSMLLYRGRRPAAVCGASPAVPQFAASRPVAVGGMGLRSDRAAVDQVHHSRTGAVLVVVLVVVVVVVVVVVLIVVVVDVAVVHSSSINSRSSGLLVSVSVSVSVFVSASVVVVVVAAPRSACQRSTRFKSSRTSA